MVIRLMKCWSVDNLPICLVKWCISNMQSTWLPGPHGNNPAFFSYQNQMSYRTASSLSSRLLFEKLIDWVIHVDILLLAKIFWQVCSFVGLLLAKISKKFASMFVCRFVCLSVRFVKHNSWTLWHIITKLGPHMEWVSSSSMWHWQISRSWN